MVRGGFVELGGFVGIGVALDEYIDEFIFISLDGEVQGGVSLVARFVDVGDFGDEGQGEVCFAL